MKTDKDNAINEVIGFVFVLLIVVVFVSLFALAVMPAYTQNNEIAQNRCAELALADLKTDIDLTCISKLTGVVKIKTVEFKASKSNPISGLITPKRYGTLYLKKGNKTASENYCNLVIEYTSANIFADDITIIYDGGTLTSNTGGKTETILLRESDYRTVVANDFSDTAISGTDFAVLEYSLTEVNDDERCYVLNVWAVLR